MKDIKSYVIGFLTCACLFLIMGQTSEIDYQKLSFQIDSMKAEIKNNPKWEHLRDNLLTTDEREERDNMTIGKYQISTVVNQGGVWASTINTATGEIFKREYIKFQQFLK